MRRNLVLFLVASASVPAFAAAPTATTVSASGINTTQANLNGAGNPNGESSTGWFRYSTVHPGTCDDTFGVRVPAVGGTVLGAGISSVPYSITPTGLTPGTTYYFCAIVSNASGTAFGAVFSFNTLGPPAVTTSASTTVTASSATLNGSATPNSSTTTGHYRYSTTSPGTCNDTFGTRAPASSASDAALGSGTTAVPWSNTIAGLTPATTYFYCAIATNAFGTAFGAVLSFTTLPALPVATTSSATSLTGTTAQLNGSANPGGASATGYFRYATTSPGTCNDSFGTRAPATGGSALGSGNTSVAFSQGLTGLTPGTTYYFCAIAQSAAGTGLGAVLVFTTPTPPVAATTAASFIADTSAQLNATGTPNGAATTGWFRYSATDPGSCNDTFGSRAPVTGGTSLGSGTSPITYAEFLSGLSAGTTYYYCAIASSAEGTSFGAVLTFTTAAAPTVTTNAPTLITSSSLTLNGSANPNLNAAFGYFRYSTLNPVTCNDTFGTRAPPSSASDTSLGAGAAPVAYSRGITGLLPATTYYFCAIGRNSYGTSFGAVLSVTTLPNLPSVSTGSATSLTGTSAQLNGSANPGGAATTAWFRYATTSPGTCNDTFGTRAPATGGSSLGSGNSSVAFSQGLAGLSPGTTYFYCAIAQNAVGTSFGAVAAFTTPTPPLAVTTAATFLADTSAQLNGTGTPNGSATTGWFRYSATDPGTCNDTFGSRAPVTGGTSLGSSTSPVSYAEFISGLSAGTTYYFCAIASSAEGTSFGAVLTFTTAAAPTVTTSAATLITSSSLTLNGSANPNLNAAFGYFRYSTLNPVTCNDTFGTRAPPSSASDTSLGAGSSPVAYSRGITGLLPATTYYFCAIGRNSYGTSFGAVLSVTTLPNPPSVSTGSATSLTGTSAQLNGSSNPGGSATTAWFRYATTSPGTCNDTFGTRAPATGGSSLGSGNSSVAFSQGITGLSPGTTYFFCAIAQNAVGTSFGAVNAFTTPTPPVVTTSAASFIADTNAQLNGTGTPNGASTTGWFRYSATNPGTCNDLFGSRAPVTGGTNLGSSTSPITYAEFISGLSPATTYYFCAIASSAEGTSFGAVLSFTTAATPTVTTNAATLVTSTSLTLNGSANPNLNASFGYFRYSLTNPGTCTDSFGTRVPASSASDTSLGAGATPVAYANSVGGLAPGATYYYCALARNSFGTSFGAVLSVTTNANLPSVSTSSASLVTATSAQLNGSANPGGSATTGWFRYATTSPGTCNDTFGTRAPATGGSSLGSGNSSVAFSQGVSGLSPGTTYFYCAIAQNAVGTSLGSILSFTTPALPSVATAAASPVTSNSATLNATATPNGSATIGWFRWDTTSPGACNDTFGTRAPFSGGTSLGSGATAVAYAEALSGLVPSTTYFFCAIAQNAAGTVFGNVLSFTTPAALPSVTTSAATLVGASAATLNAAGTPNGAATTGWFRYSTTNPGTCNDTFGTRAPATAGSALGAGNSAVTFSEALTGLTPSTTYYFCAIAQNAVGTSFGFVLNFTTPNAPVVTTLAASALGGSTATLNGNANPRGDAATGWFRYSTTNPGTCDDTFGTRAPATGGTSLGAGTSAVAFSQGLSGLSSGTTYFFCAIAQNSVGTVFGAVLSFTTLPAPVVTTAAATLVASTTATLNGSANPNGLTTTGWYRYSLTDPGACNDTFGTRAPAAGGTSLGAGTAAVPYGQALTGLTSGATYYYCAIASSSAGTSFGAVMSFTTLAAPLTTTAAASVVVSTTATLNGSANPRGSATTGWFRYSATSPGACNDTFGTRLPATGGTALGAGTTAVAYSQGLSGLTPGTTYFFCAIAQNSLGTTFGALLSFTTLAAPTVTTAAASSLGSTGATLNGSANPRGDAATGWFRYATTNPGTCNDTFGTRAPASGGASLGAGTAAVAFSQAVTGLTPGTTYYFCALASNSIGTSVGGVFSFTTPASPLVTTSAASGVTTTAAVLNGSGNPNFDATTGWFRYSATNPGTCDDTFGTRAPASGGSSLGSGSTAVTFSQPVTGLTPGTTYYFCAIAQNTVGTSFGAVLTFTTLAAPIVTTSAATLVGSTTATLNGSANPQGSTATGWFRYSTVNPGTCNDTFGTRAPTTGGTALGAGSTAVAYSRALTGLTLGTTYYFCAIASNAQGTSFGAVLTFATPNAPLVTTSAASAVSSSSATLNGSADPRNGDATGWFRYATTNPGTCNDTFGTRTPATGGSALGAGSGAVPFTQGISGLAPFTTYYFCAIASNVVGTAFGAVLSFTTPAGPSVTTLAATGVTGTTATLQGQASPNASATTGWFRYAAVDPGSCNDTFGTRAPAAGGTSLGSGSAVVPYSEALTGLTPGTTYWFCAIAQNAVGTSFGAVRSFTAPGAPLVTASPATAVGPTTATLNAGANPRGAATTGWFRFSVTDPGTCSDTFGTRAPATGGTALGAGTASAPYTQGLTGLLEATTYYWCALASNSEGVAVSAVQSFTTPALPVVTTAAATGVSGGSATLNGSGNPRGTATTAWFRYGTTNPGACNDTFGTRVPLAGTPLGAGNAAVPFAEPLTGLAAGTTYYFCAIASNPVATVFGAVLTFSTPAAPSVTSVAASGVGSTAATLNGTANPNNDATTGWFRYSTTSPAACNDTFGTRAPAAGGTALGSGSAVVPFSEALTGLVPATTYFYCAIAQNSAGLAFGSVRTFTTLAAPVVTTLAASAVTGTGATLNGNGNPRGDATTGWFRYATTSPGTCNDTFGTRAPSSSGSALGSGTAAVAFSQALAGLTPETTYYFCAIAQNSVATSFGAVLTFTTPAQLPVVTTEPASAVGMTAATLNGTADPRGSATTAWFRYGTASPGTCNDTFGTRSPSSGGTSVGPAGGATPYSQALTGLTSGTTYYYCAIASTSAGNAFGAVLTFTTPGVPRVTTSAASNLTSSAARLNGSASPTGVSATGWFRYATVDPGACNDTFGTRAPATAGTALGAGTADVTFNQDLTGLTPGTTYYFCAVASNAQGTGFGAVLTFSTSAAPSVMTSSASNVTGTTATLNGAANPNRALATGWFRIGLNDPGTCNDTFGTRLPSMGGTDLGAGSTPASFSVPAMGLQPGRKYWFCAIASNAVGTSFGDVLTFTSVATPPTVTTNAATNLEGRGAVLNGTVNGNGTETTGWFRYSQQRPTACDDTFGTRAPDMAGQALGSADATLTLAVTGLEPAATYHYCAIASNAGGARFGELVSFTTPRLMATVKTMEPELRIGLATLNGSVNPNGVQATAWFQYGGVKPSECSLTFGTKAPAEGIAVGSGTAEVPISYLLNDLPAGTVYYCAVAQTESGTVFGEVMSFESSGPQKGCGCGAGAGAPLALLALVALWRRRRQGR